MANDPDNITVGSNGKLLIGPVGTTAPTDLTTAWDAAWVDVGFLNEDGASISKDRTVEARRAWQSLHPVRRIVKDMDFTVEFTMIEFKKSNVQIALEGAITTTSGVHKFVPSAPEVLVERALGLEWQDGASRKYRLVVPKVVSMEGVEFGIQRSEESGLPLTMGIVAADGVDAFVILSNDPAWAA